MRYRVKKDFVLEGTLLAFGDSLFLQQTQNKGKWEVYSLYTRNLVGEISTDEVKENLEEDKRPPKDKFGEFMDKKNKSIKSIFILAFIFFLPLRGISQISMLKDPAWRPVPSLKELDSLNPKYPIKWQSKLVQVSDDVFELHTEAFICNNYFLYPLNRRNKCALCPQLKLKPSPDWEVIEGPEIYSYGIMVPAKRCSEYNLYCSIERFETSVEFIQLIKRVRFKKGSEVTGMIEYYSLRTDKIGRPDTFSFSHPFDERITISYAKDLQPVMEHGRMVKKLTAKEVRRYYRRLKRKERRQ